MDDIRPFTRRGILSIINSIYGPLGFIALVILGDRMVLKKAMNSKVDWDDRIPDDLHADWEKWRTSLSSMKSLRIPKMFVDIQYITRSELHTFFDASKDVTGTVTCVKLYNIHGQLWIGEWQVQISSSPQQHDSAVRTMCISTWSRNIRIYGRPP